MTNLKTSWILCDNGKIGTLRQCEALAEVLHLNPTVFNIDLGWWRQIIPASWSRFLPSPNPQLTQAQLPDLVIAAGRRSVPLAVYLSNKTKVIFIQDPKISPHYFTAVIAPAHDHVKGENVITTIGSLHKITPAFLKNHIVKIRFPFEAIKRPIMSVFIGGDSKHYQYTKTLLDDLCQQLLRFLRDTGGSLCITPSRRTRQEHISYIQQKLENTATIIWNGEGDNPYFDFMSMADMVCVTSDSISMMSECCSSGKPVYLFPIPITHAKFQTFTHRLITDGYAKLLDHHNDFNVEKQNQVLTDMATVMARLPKL